MYDSVILQVALTCLLSNYLTKQIYYVFITL